MKYILKNKQAFDAIYKYLDEALTINKNLKIGQGWDKELEDFSDDLIHFYVDQTYREDFEYVTFKWLIKNFPHLRPDVRLHYKNSCPFLRFEQNSEFRIKMNNMFGENWKPVFEKWFSDKFPHYPVTTFDYE